MKDRSRGVAFLFTDVEGSSRLWDEQPERMADLLATHDSIIRSVVGDYGGEVFATGGDSFAVAFEMPDRAVANAVAAQRRLIEELGGRFRIRMAVHCGDVEERDGGFFGPVLNRCARLRDTAHGGQILLTRAVRDQVHADLPPGVSLVDLGEHRLRDLAAPERVFQVVAEGLPAEFPPIRSLGAFVHNLPTQLTSFIGRTDEQAALTGLLNDHRLVSIVGPGGSGKTRLALQQAAELLSDYPDGCWWVDLLPVGSVDDVADRVQAALGIQALQAQDPLDSVLAALRDRSLLLLLDNCEHVVDPVAEVVHRLLDETRVRVLATSRRPLRVAGEHIYLLDPLPVPEPGQTARIAANASVRLLADRAAEAGSPLDVAAHSEAVSTICRRLDGMPLALELVAARLRALTPEETAAHLDRALPLLTLGPRSDERHTTLEATIAWSVGLLTEDQRSLFERLAVFPASWTLPGARSICSDGPSPDCDLLHAALVDQSLVTVAEYPNGERRYRFLQTVREYAENRLDTSAQYEMLRHRFVDYYHDMITAGGRPADHPPAEGPDPFHDGHDAARFDRLVNEAGNVTEAIAAAVDLGRPVDALRIVGWGGWLALYGRTEHARRIDDLVAASVAVADQTDPEDASAAVRATCFIMSALDLDRFWTLSEDSARRCRRLGLERSALVAEFLAADALHHMGRAEEAAARMEDIIARAPDDRLRGYVLANNARPGEAGWKLAEEGWRLAGFDQVIEFHWPEDPWWFSRRAQQAGRYELALDLARRAFQAAEARRLPIVDVHCRHTIAEILAVMGRLDEAAEAAHEGVVLGRRLLGPTFAASMALLAAAEVARRRGEADAATEWLKEARTTAQRNEVRAHILRAVEIGAQVARDAERWEEAESACDRAEAMCREFGWSAEVGTVARIRASIALRVAKPQEALRLLRENVGSVDDLDLPLAVEWLAIAAASVAFLGGEETAGRWAAIVERERTGMGVMPVPSDVEFEERAFNLVRNSQGWEASRQGIDDVSPWDALREAVASG